MSRSPGQRNKASPYREALLAKRGLMPVDFLLGVMRNERNGLKDRVVCAVAVAPYCHPKLSQVDTRIWTEMQTRATDAFARVDPGVLTAQQREGMRALVALVRRTEDDANGTLDGAFEVKGGPA